MSRQCPQCFEGRLELTCAFPACKHPLKSWSKVHGWISSCDSTNPFPLSPLSPHASMLYYTSLKCWCFGRNINIKYKYRHYNQSHLFLSVNYKSVLLTLRYSSLVFSPAASVSVASQQICRYTNWPPINFTQGFGSAWRGIANSKESIIWALTVCRAR